MLGNIIAAILIGIVAGYLGRLLLPGKDPMGFVGTVIAGIIGAIIGTMIVLLIWRAISGRMGGGTRPTTGTRAY